MRKALTILAVAIGTGSLLSLLAFKLADAFITGVHSAAAAGYIDTQNHLAIDLKNLPKDQNTHQYSMGPFIDGMAIISSLPSQRCRFIDTHGNVRSKYYLRAGDFIDGLAPAQRIADRLVGYINKEDMFVIPPRFLEARNFSQGLAAVRNAKALWGFIDRSGKQAIACRYAQVGDFHDGVAFFSEDGRTFGYLTKDGKVVCPPQFATIWDFSEGIGVADNHSGRFFINPDGSVRATLHAIATPAHSRFAGAPLRAGAWSGRIISQKWAGENKYGDDASVHSGLAAVSTSSGSYFVDSYGNKPAGASFDYARAFHEGKAVCFKNARAIILDTSFHETLLPASFEWVDDFSGGLALVKDTHGTINAIDKTGKLLWAPSSQSASIGPFSEGMAATDGATLW